MSVHFDIFVAIKYKNQRNGITIKKKIMIIIKKNSDYTSIKEGKKP